MIYRFDHSTFAFYIINAGDWELQFVSTPNKARTPIVQGDEIEIAGRMYKKYTALAKEYYQDFKADAIKDGKTYENLGE